MALNDLRIRNLKTPDKPTKVTDEGGLYLLSTPTGSKLWRFDFRLDGRRLTMSFGPWPKVGLAKARELREAAKATLREGRDPRVAEGKERVRKSFKDVAERWLESEFERWSDENTRRIRNRLEADVYPVIGNKPINEIEPAEVLEMVRQVEERGVRETAHRIRGYAGSIFRFGIAEGICQRDPAADVRGALKRKPRVQNRARFKASELPEFLSRLETSDLDQETRDALMLTLLCASRTDETRFSHRDEFEQMDGDEPLWRISGERMKMHREHLIPLSRQAADIVRRRLNGVGPSGLLFASRTRSKVISENTMLFGLYRLGYHSKATVHGFRGTFSTIANEHNWNADWIEMVLAHVEGSVRGAYNAALYLPQRRKLLQWWADYLDARSAEQTN